MTGISHVDEIVMGAKIDLTEIIACEAYLHLTSIDPLLKSLFAEHCCAVNQQ